ncbi:MAG: DUF5678 domain-containing protein [bacterium]|nr:DUF5678 domain-containing protein [bacterium]
MVMPRNYNDEYFTEHFEELVAEHGGEWIVVARGELIGVGPKYTVREMLKKAREKFPHEIPLASPIPKEEEIECIL